MSETEILHTYTIIAQYYEKYLKQHGVKPISLKSKNGAYTKDALVLVRLAKGYPNTETLSKQELTEFIRIFYPDVVDVQQARHLSKQRGYYIISGTRGDIGQNIKAGHYKLVDLQTPYPSFKPDRRSGIDSGDFESLKKEYDYRCATCGSIEGKPHNIRKNEITQLQEGHINPAKPLKIGNIIPQCQVCNRPDRDRWIYDNTGRVIAVADSEDGKRVVEKYLKQTNRTRKEYFLDFLKKLLGLKS